MDMYRHWTSMMHGGATGGSLTGALLGICVCLCINCCTAGCSHRTLSASTDSTVQLTETRDSLHSDSTYSSSSVTDMSRRWEEWLSQFNATWKKTTYEYDSLGNRRVASEETASISGSEQKKDSAENTRLLTSTFIITNTDTVHDSSNMNQHNQSSVTEYSIPWYCKLFMYLGIALLAIAIATIAYLYIKCKRK